MFYLSFEPVNSQFYLYMWSTLPLGYQDFQEFCYNFSLYNPFLSLDIIHISFFYLFRGWIFNYIFLIGYLLSIKDLPAKFLVISIYIFWNFVINHEFCFDFVIIEYINWLKLLIIDYQSYRIYANYALRSPNYKIINLTHHLLTSTFQFA